MNIPVISKNKRRKKLKTHFISLAKILFFGGVTGGFAEFISSDELVSSLFIFSSEINNNKM